MRVGIIVAQGQDGLCLKDVLRAEYLAAATRVARHRPKCVLLKYPIDPVVFESQINGLGAHLLLYYTTPENCDLVGEMTELAYRLEPSRPQFLTGPWTTLSPELALKLGPINGLLRGEPDVTLGRLLNSLGDREALKKTPGLWLRRVNAPTHQVDIGPVVDPDQEPVPDFRGFDWPAIAAVTQGAAPAEASRGCEGRSAFNWSADLRRHFKNPDGYRRIRPVDDVIRDIQTLRMRIDPLRLEFIDEIFPSQEEWLKTFAEKYSREINLPFSARLASSAHTPAVIEQLVKAGLDRAILDIESGDEDFRAQFTNLHPSNKQIREVVAAAVELGCEVHVNVLHGLPGEREKHHKKTLEFLRNLPFTSVAPHPFVLVPGAKLFNKCQKEGMVKSNPRSGTRETLLRSSKALMEIGRFNDAVYRLNLEKQIERHPSRKGYFSFVDHAPTARHEMRRIECLNITHYKGAPAFTVVVPAINSFQCFIEPNSLLQAKVRLLSFGQDEDLGGRVRIQISFIPEGGGEIRLFSGRLSLNRKKESYEIETPIAVSSMMRGIMVFSARDDGGGDGYTVAWVDPVLERSKKIQRPSEIPSSGDDASLDQPPPISTPAQPVPKFNTKKMAFADEFDLDDEISSPSDPPDRSRDEDSAEFEFEDFSRDRNAHGAEAVTELKAMRANVVDIPDFSQEDARDIRPVGEESKAQAKRRTIDDSSDDISREIKKGNLGDQLIKLMEELQDQKERILSLERKNLQYKKRFREQREMIERQSRELEQNRKNAFSASDSESDF